MFATGLLSKRASLLSIAGYILSLGGFYIIHQGLTDVFFSYQTSLAIMQYGNSLLAAALGCCLLFFYHFLVRLTINWHHQHHDAKHGLWLLVGGRSHCVQCRSARVCSASGIGFGGAGRCHGCVVATTARQSQRSVVLWGSVDANSASDGAFCRGTINQNHAVVHFFDTSIGVIALGVIVRVCGLARQ